MDWRFSTEQVPKQSIAAAPRGKPWSRRQHRGSEHEARDTERHGTEAGSASWH
jgi:hypothetical protein